MANDTNGDTRGTSDSSRGFSSSSSSGSGGPASSKSGQSSGANTSNTSGANSRGMTSGENAANSGTSSSASSGGSRSTAGKTSSNVNSGSQSRGVTSDENATRTGISGLTSLGTAIGHAVNQIGSSIGTALGFEKAAPTAATAAGVGALTGNPAVVAREMKAAGYPDVAIAGFIGTLQQESYADLRTTARSKGDATDGTDSMGIGQYNMGRLTGPNGLNAFAKDNNMNVNDITTQAKFAVHELATTESSVGKALMNAKSIDEAAKAAVAYERPAGYNIAAKTGDYSAVSGWANRVSNANNIAKSLGATPTNTDDPYGATAVADAAISKTTPVSYRDPSVTTAYQAKSPLDATASMTPKADIPNPTGPNVSNKSMLGTIGTVIHAAVDPVGFLVGAVSSIGKPKNADGTTDNSNDPLGVASALQSLTSGSAGSVADLHGYGQNNSKTLDAQQTADAKKAAPVTSNLDDIQKTFADKQAANPYQPVPTGTIPSLPTPDFALQSKPVMLDQIQPLNIEMLAPFSWSKLTDTQKKSV